MSQQGANLPMDVEGSPSSGGAGSAGTTGSGSGSSMPASPAISPPQDVQGSHDDDTSSGKATPTTVGLALAGADGSSSVKLSLASEDNTGGLEPASPLAVQADDSNTGSKPASPAVVAYTVENNNDGLKPASPAGVVSAAGESDKAEGKDELFGEDLDAGGDAAGDSDDVTGKNSKSITSSLDGGDFQGDAIKDDAPTSVAADCGGGKGKSAAAEGDHALHFWTERERRKKMKNLYTTLHSLLPGLPQEVDKATIVGKAVDYIKTLESTLKGLEKLKLECIRAQLLGAGSSRAAPLPPPAARRESTLADMVNNWNAQQAAAAPHGTFQTWSAHNIAVSVTGNESFISVCVPRQPGVVTKALYVLKKYRIDVITLNISSDENRIIFSIHTHMNAAPGHIALELMTAENRYKLAASELLWWISAN